MRHRFTALAVVGSAAAVLLVTAPSAGASTPASSTGVQPRVSQTDCEAGGGWMELDPYGNPFCSGGVYNGKPIDG